MNENNRLELDMEGTQFCFRIVSLRSGGEDDNWFITELSVRSDCFNYTFRGEAIQLDEMHWLRDELKSLLSGNFKEPKEISFLEPDYELMLNPAVDLGKRSDAIVIPIGEEFPNFSELQERGITQCIREGHEVIDIDLDFRINLSYEGCYSGQQYLLPFDRPEIEQLCDYISRELLRYPLEK